MLGGYVRVLAVLGGRGQSGHGIEQDAFEALQLLALFIAEVGEHAARFTLAKAQIAQSGEGFGLDFDGAWVERLPVGATVGVPEAQAIRNTTADQELAAMSCTVMHTAHSNEVGRLIATTF